MTYTEGDKESLRETVTTASGGVGENLHLNNNKIVFFFFLVCLVKKLMTSYGISFSMDQYHFPNFPSGRVSFFKLGGVRVISPYLKEDCFNFS